MRKTRWTSALTWAAVLLAAASALAQPAATGTVYGRVNDESGASVPGATVTLTGSFGSRATTSDAQGAYRFLNVPHGPHQLTASLPGFTSVQRNLTVAVGQNLDLDFKLKVSSVEVKHVDLPPDMQRAMARQAEAEREKRAKIIHAAGELEASEKLAQAAGVIATEPMSITLRYLQTLTEIASEKNSTIIFPLPIELIHLISGKKQA